MVSALAYVVYAFTELFKSYGVVSGGFAVSGVAIGVMLLVLSAFWHRVRAVLLGYLPSGWTARLPGVR